MFLTSKRNPLGIFKYFLGKYGNLLSIMILEGFLHSKWKMEGKISQNIFQSNI